MRLFMTGATGLIGRRLVLDRLERGDRVVLLSRDALRAESLFAAGVNPNVSVVLGNPAAPGDWQQAVSECDAVVHLAGAGLADRRWTAEYKQTIVSSRIDSTRHLVDAIAQLPADRRPKTLISGSAIGWYGDTGSNSLDETAPAAADFLGRLCAGWEAQAKMAERCDVRVVFLRTGIVLDDRGGALPKMAKPFRYFAGGPIGTGRQLMSWIHWRDIIGLIELALHDNAIMGPVNATAPQVVSNRQFAATLGAVLGRPSWLPVPRLALRVVAGEFAKYIVQSQGVLPAKAIRHGYRFVYPALEPAVESLLGRAPETAGEPVERTPRALVAPRRAASRPSSAPPAETMPTVPIRLAAIAVDGTLLRSDGSISQGVIQACRAAERAGCVVVLATARPPRGMRSLLQTLDLTSPTINYNGAVIWNPLDERAQYHEPIAAELAAAIVRDARGIDAQVVIGLEVLDRWYTDRLDARFDAQTVGLMPPDYIGPLDAMLASPVTKINIIGPPDRLTPVLAMITERYWKPRQVSVFLGDPSIIQISHPLVDKGIALQRVARKLGVSRQQVMAVGDGANDAGMIEWAGFGVAVANASPALQQLAKAVVASNDDQGVARAIQRFVLALR